MIQKNNLIDLNIAHAKSVTFRVSSDLNVGSAQASTSNFAVRVPPTDFKTSHGTSRLLGGNRLTESKAHNRQTSIVHGYQHSRNGSKSSTSSSPLSPQIIALAGGERTDVTNMDNSFTIIAPSGINSGVSPSSLSSNITTTLEQLSIPTDDGIQNDSLKRHGRKQNSNGSKDLRRLISISKTPKEELKIVNEVAFQVLFASFITLAEEKINQCITGSSDPEPYIEKICGPKVDPAFDHLISSLVHVARQKPKSLIDSLMLWRKSKSDEASDARAQLQQAAVLEEVTPVTNLPSTTALQDVVALAERRSIVSIYILCRVLIEVIGQCTLVQITADTEEKLEGIIFGQLKSADTDQLSQSPIKLANWLLFSKLLGAMAEINFKSITERFIYNLEKLQKDLVVKNGSNRESERKMELVLAGIKYVRIKVQSEEVWDQSCDFMISMGQLFAQSHGHRLKYAFCQAFETLLLPIAAQADSEFKIHKWSEFLGTIGPHVASMLIKPRHWAVAFPMTATLLCVSPIDSFTTQWLQLILPLQSKLKDRFTRPICLQIISRLLWTYLYRAPADTMNITIKKIEEVLKLIFPTGRKSYLTMDPTSSDPLIQIIRIIGFKYQEFCLKNVIFPLINADIFSSGRDLKIEQLEPEKIVIGIKSFVSIISDLEKGEIGQPPFPLEYPLDYHRFVTSDRIPASFLMNTHRTQTIDETEPSFPILTNTLNDSILSYYTKFCEILGKITIICDSAYGSQAASDEKFNSPTSKTPLSDSFSSARRDDHQALIDSKQAFYELFNVIVQILPRFRSNDIPINTLISLLCTGTAHSQSNIAESSANSLKSIARQSYAHQVTISYSKFIFSFDDRYSSIFEGGMLEPSQIECSLQLYYDLLLIWIGDVRLKISESSHEDINIEKRGIPPDIPGTYTYIDEIEAHVLFFLCSQSGKVRAISVTMLRLIKEFDILFGKNCKRLIDVLEEESQNLMNLDDGHLSVSERSRLQRGMRNGSSEIALIELCISETSYDSTLWLKIFPNLIQICYDRCPLIISITRELIGNRILQMYKSIVALSEVTRGPQYGSFDRYESGSSRNLSRSSTTPPEVLIEQWKLYLIFNCTTLADKGGYQQSSPPPIQHKHKGSKPNYSQEKITSARILFKYIVPLLSVSSASIRGSVVVSLGSINVNIYKILLEELQGVVSKCNEDAKLRVHRRTTSNSWKNRRTDLLRTEVAHVYQLTAHFLKDPDIYQDEWILNNIVAYTKDLKQFLMDPEVQANWEFQKLRRYFCGVIEELFEGISLISNPSRWLDFESIKSSFALMEDWCGFSTNQSQVRQREDSMKQSIIDQQSYGEWSTITAAMEIEKRNLRTAALSAMAALCGGPLSFTAESPTNLQTDVRRMLSWINTTLSAGNDRMHFVGRKALKSLITHNKDISYLLEYSIARCYVAEHSKVLESYFDVIVQVLLEDPDYSIPFWRLLAIGLFTLLSESSEVRLKAANLLQALEEREEQSSIIQSYKKNISDKTRTVYKLAQYEISTRLSRQYPDITYYIHSEFAAYYKDLPEVSRRNILAMILPWTQIVELKIDFEGELTAQSFALLTNVCEISFRSGETLQNEVQALWQALVSPHEANLQPILKFVISLCLDRREQNSLEFAKHIIVYLSNKSLEEQIVEFLISRITPKDMIANDRYELIPPTTEALELPYTTDLRDIFPVLSTSSGISLGQLSLILLVDLVVSPIQLFADNLPLLLHLAVSLWDHYISIVQDQVRELLIHLAHELIIAKIDVENLTTQRNQIGEFVESARSHDPKIFWSYEDYTGDYVGKLDESDHRTPLGMGRLTKMVNESFRLTYLSIQEDWTKLSLAWAISCPVTHIACRSFQIFRCINTSFNQSMLASMLEKLSNTISNEDSDLKALSIEILTTLKSLIYKSDSTVLLRFPQFFWTICACLDTVIEVEFQELICMLEALLNRIDLDNSNVRSIINEGRPMKWEGQFEGLQTLIYKGLRSSLSLDISLRMINKLIQLPNDDLIGNDTRIFFAVLANFPAFLQSIDQNSFDSSNMENSRLIAEVAKSRGYNNIFKALNNYSMLKYRTSKDFIAQLVSAIKEAFLPQYDFEGFIFLVGLLSNSLGWFKLKTLDIICAFIAEIDMYKPEIKSQAPDIISPLLRLLQTNYRTQALEVLDQITIVTSAPIDNHQVRMSMVSSQSKAVRKEYERTPSLYGIPDMSGWSIPVPAKYAEITRANVFSVFCSCQNAENQNSPIQLIHEVDFNKSNFLHEHSQITDRTENIFLDYERGESDIGELILKLNSLDEFFESCSQSPSTENIPPLPVSRKGSEAELFPEESQELGAQFNDEQTFPILHKSFSNPLSNSSFKNGFVDSGFPKPNTMNPGAFHNASSSSKRPTYTYAQQPPLQLQPHISDDEYNEVFSDGDDDRNVTHVESSFFLENIIKPLPQGIRSSMRRLTSGRSRDFDRMRESLRIDRRGTSGGNHHSQQPKSPKVPRVPSAYLQKTISPG
ncbi:hypothetical protein EPUL_000061, partial [Erysiphe pulchra]